MDPSYLKMLHKGKVIGSRLASGSACGGPTRDNIRAHWLGGLERQSSLGQDTNMRSQVGVSPHTRAMGPPVMNGLHTVILRANLLGCSTQQCRSALRTMMLTVLLLLPSCRFSMLRSTTWGWRQR